MASLALAALVGVGFGSIKYIPNLIDKVLPIIGFQEKKPAAQFSSVIVTSKPAGAKILLNGNNTNKTSPTTISDLKVGNSYSLRLELEGYSPINKKMNITSIDPTYLNLTMIKPTGSLIITSQPSGSQILVNGKNTGLVTPATVDELTLKADQKIVLKKEGHENYEQTVNLSNTKPQPMIAELKAKAPEKARLSISSTPSGASVLLDNKKTGRTTPTELTNLDIGKYTIQLELTGYGKWQGQLNINKPQAYQMAAILTKSKVPIQKIEPAPAKKEPKKKKIATTGSLRVKSTPSGAHITVDGKRTGKKTPATITNLAPGQHTISLNISGRKAWSRSATIVAGKTRSLTGSLTAAVTAATPAAIPKKKPSTTPRTKKPVQTRESAITGGTGTIKLSSKPSGADVFINAEYKGKTPITVKVPSGKAQVIVNKEGKLRYTNTVNVKPNQTLKLTSIKLGNIYGEVRLTSVPPRATITYDGKTIPPKTPVTIRKIRRDQVHTITLSLPGYHPWTKSFKVTGKSITLNAFLQKQ